LKRITLIVRQAEISRIFPDGLQLLVEDEACVLDVIRKADDEMREKGEIFPLGRCKDLLHMVYHSTEDRFYKQVAIQAYAPRQPFLNIRENLRRPLPDQATIILIPEGGCASDWEQPVK
jgi:hypothetical protein